MMHGAKLDIPTLTGLKIKYRVGINKFNEIAGIVSYTGLNGIVFNTYSKEEYYITYNEIIDITLLSHEDKEKM